MKLTDDQLEFFNRLSAFAESVHKLPDKFVDTKLIFSLLIIQALLIGVCTLYLKNLVYQTLIPPPILELIK